MILGKYNQAKTITFDLFEIDGVDLSVAATFASGDVKIMKDEGAEANTTNLPTDEGSSYSLVLTATEMSAARIRIILIDQTGTKVWLDTTVGLETYGNASAEHAFDLDTASAAQTVDNNVLAAGSTGFAAIDTVVDAIQVVTDKFAFTVANQVDSNQLSSGGTAQTANDNGADINTILSRIIGTLAAGTHNPQSGDAYARLATYRLGELMSAALASQPFTASLLGDLTQDNADAAGTQQFTVAALMRVWDEVLTGATHNIPTSSGRRLRGIQENGSVYNGEVHVDTNNGVTGVVPYENGTSDNATLTWAEALIIAPLVNGGLSDYHLINGSSIGFTSSMANKSLFGDNYTVALGGQNCADVHIQGASVSGVGTAATGEMGFDGCNFGTASIQSGHFDFCAFADTITHTLAGDYKYHNCYSDEAGGGSSTFTKTAGQTITSQWRNWAGSIIVSTIESGDVMTIGGTLGTVTLNGADGTVEIRGSYKAIIDNRTGSPTLNLDGAMQSDDLVDLVWDEVISKASHNIGQSAAKVLRQGGDLVQIDGAVSDVSPATTGFDTSLTQADDYFDDAVLIFSDGAANEGIGRPVVTYLNANGAMTFLSPDDWPVTPVNGDDFVIFATHVHPVSQIQSGLATEAKQDIIDTNVDDLKLGIIYGAAATGTLSTTVATSDLTGYTDDQMIGRIITVTSGPAEGESSDITDYAATSGTLTFTAMTLAMQNGNSFKVT